MQNEEQAREKRKRKERARTKKIGESRR